MRRNRLFLVGAVALAAISTGACGGNVSTVGTGGHGATTTSGTTTTPTTGTGGGTICGGLAGTTCGPGEYCDFPDKQCGGNDGAGTCTPDPQGCNDIYQPTCGCDGKIYGNDCAAQMVGVDVNDNGGCPAPAGQFGCGAHFCALGIQYCHEVSSDGSPSSYECDTLPASCGAAPSCACLSAVLCGSQCTPTSDGGLKVTCHGV